MPIHEDRQVQHAASNGLQRSTSDCGLNLRGGV